MVMTITLKFKNSVRLLYPGIDWYDALVNDRVIVFKDATLTINGDMAVINQEKHSIYIPVSDLEIAVTEIMENDE